mmetsp:Transcript_17560/g.59677  ORF Transcript_17560/g.59677 Transcript_17560/m.59677 type:complete len:321 (+) Transcript_17560:641-1603(+)
MGASCRGDAGCPSRSGACCGRAPRPAWRGAPPRWSASTFTPCTTASRRTGTTPAAAARCGGTKSSSSSTRSPWGRSLRTWARATASTLALTPAWQPWGLTAASLFCACPRNPPTRRCAVMQCTSRCARGRSTPCCSSRCYTTSQPSTAAPLRLGRWRGCSGLAAGPCSRRGPWSRTKGAREGSMGRTSSWRGGCNGSTWSSRRSSACRSRITQCLRRAATCGTRGTATCSRRGSWRTSCPPWRTCGSWREATTRETGTWCWRSSRTSACRAPARVCPSQWVRGRASCCGRRGAAHPGMRRTARSGSGRADKSKEGTRRCL